MIDLKTLTDEELDTARTDILCEQERRQRLATAPDQVRGIAAAYTADGGNPDDLVSAISGDVTE